MLKWATLKWVAGRDVQGASWGFGLVTCLGVFAAWVRLLPWMFARDMPSAVIWPFARVLLASGLELALQVGVPLGWLVGWILAVERGELRALGALGLRPSGLAWRSAVGLSALALCVACATRLLSGPVDSAPSRVLSEFVTAGQRFCDGHPGEVARIPVGGLVEHCDSRRVVGRIPGSRPAWFAISDPRQVSSSEFELGASEWLVQSADDRWIHVDVGRVRVRGFVAPKAMVRGWGRTLGLAASGGLMAWFLLPLLHTLRSRGVLVVCALTSVLGVVVLKEVDRRALPSIAYGLLPILACLGWISALLLDRLRTRLLSR
ncbi:MAG: hypothetical protein KC492_35400 [Myxococcales bacterium]|nr:hypothetical protein [Myxococcales bacterium]